MEAGLVDRVKQGSLLKKAREKGWVVDSLRTALPGLAAGENRKEVEETRGFYIIFTVV